MYLYIDYETSLNYKTKQCLVMLMGAGNNQDDTHMHNAHNDSMHMMNNFTKT